MHYRTQKILSLFVLILSHSVLNAQVGQFEMDSLENAAKQAGTPEERIDALGTLAKRIASNDPASAARLTDQMLEISKDHENDAGVAEAYNIKGSILFYQGEYDEALVEWERSYGIYARLDSLDARGTHALALASALNNMGIVHKRQGDLPEALELYYGALKIREEVGDPYPIGSSYLNIGGLYKTQGRSQEAILFFLKARDRFVEAEDVYGQAAVFNNLGNIYEEQNDGIDKALEAYQNALELFQSVENERGIGLGFNNLGIIHQLKGETEKALDLFERSLEIRTRMKDKAGVASVLQNMAKCHADLGDIEKAIEEFERSLELAEEDKMAKLLVEGHKGISRLFAEKGDYQSAYLHQQTHSMLQDSLFNKENEATLSKIQNRYESFQAARTQAALGDRLSEQEASLDLRGKMITALIVSLIIIIALLIVVVTRYQITRRLSGKLEERNLEVARANKHLLETQVSKEEKEELLKEIHHRVKNNLQIINSLLRFQSDMVKDPEVVELFEECQDRLISMSLLHEQLYRKEDLSYVNVTEYLRDLIQGLKQSYARSKNIDINIDVDIESFGVNTMIPLGLMINEIASNSFKHGFKGRESGRIDLRLEREGDKEYKLIVSDDGVGLPENIDAEDPDTLGLELVNIFVQQLDGTAEISNHIGTSYNIRFCELKETIRHVEY